ncbi:MAG: hypothetical protein EKK53_06365 [Burkholderiales bacterium]|nr:MAG: hypothetical protein EKK53_06365 [Burkholderiales bacterium]
MFAIFILWGVAGGLDQPLQASEAIADIEPMQAMPPIRLHCQPAAAFPDEGTSTGKTRPAGPPRMLLTAAPARAGEALAVPSTALFCLVIDQ